MFIRSFAVIAAKLVCAAFAVLAFAASVEAAGYITYVAANGNDANPCIAVTAPCKTLQRAVNVASANATVRVLTPLVGGASIAKSITVEGNGATVVGVITVNSVSAVVTLRGLALNGVGSVAHGINIVGAAAVQIEDCTIERYTSDGISFVATTATKLFVSNTVLRANGSDGLYADAVNAKVVIQDSRFEQNVSTGVYLKVARASVTGSDASGNGQNGFILLSDRARVTETTADNNSADGFDIRNAVSATLNSAEAMGNGAAGLHVESGGIADINDCVFVNNNGSGVNNQGGVFTRQNNMVLPAIGSSPSPFGAY